MFRNILLAGALAVCLAGPALPVHATTRLPGTQIEVEDCYYTYVLGGSWWSIECRYRIDGGEWHRACQEGTSGSPEMRLPATSVQARVVDSRVVFSAEEDVATLLVNSRRVK